MDRFVKFLEIAVVIIMVGGIIAFAVWGYRTGQEQAGDSMSDMIETMDSIGNTNLNIYDDATLSGTSVISFITSYSKHHQIMVLNKTRLNGVDVSTVTTTTDTKIAPLLTGAEKTKYIYNSTQTAYQEGTNDVINKKGSFKCKLIYDTDGILVLVLIYQI